MKSMSSDLYMIGDQVFINVDPENRSWGYKAPPDGTKCTIVGFSEIAYSRVASFGHRPGIYENRCWADVRLATGETINISSHFLAVPDDEREKRYAAIRANRDDSRFAATFIRDLPETKLWEGDVVRVHDYRMCKTYDSEYGEPIVVCRIDYECINSTRNDGSPYPFYHVSSSLQHGGYTMAFEDRELELIERGNVWKYFHSEKILFSSLEEEVKFFRLLSHYEEIINPATGDYGWSAEQVISAIREGTVDGFDVTTDFLGVTLKNPVHHAVRFHNRKLGKRVAAEVIRNFEGVDIQKMENNLRDRMLAKA